jgi:hypothetical protein
VRQDAIATKKAVTAKRLTEIWREIRHATFA